MTMYVEVYKDNSLNSFDCIGYKVHEELPVRLPETLVIFQVCVCSNSKTEAVAHVLLGRGKTVYKVWKDKK